ncbi:serine/threonine-protein kinase [Nocardia sp. NPDC058058]|uniref:serine/threonine-protein kinase n=1 Tax=Nocardia sp. NPDC058058 TaxID=3346317 RepID=UPI0036DA6918
MTIRPLAQGDPQQIGRYRILGILGSGGMGRVLLGAGPDGRLVAVKQVHAHLLGEREYRSRFLREVTASTRVSGAFTAPVIDFDVDASAPWLASVFVVGVPLDSAVSQYGPLPPSAVRMLAAGLASALQEIHRAGLIHRDLKPANVLLAADGPRVIDFGIAQLSENPEGLTEVGSVLGSPGYMSPEQALSEPLTPASDVFSLGSLLFMAATGASPFAAFTLAYTLFNIVHVEADLSGVPTELRELLAPCLSKDPAARPTPTQILDYLGRLEGFGRPWPEPILHEIGGLGTELAALAADPEATSVLPGARRNSQAAQRVVELASGRQRRRSRTLVALLAVIIALVATSGAAWVRWGRTADQTTALPALTLAQLREADSCAWLRTALGSSIPAGLASAWPEAVAAWTFTPTWVWGCEASAGTQTLTFEPGAHLFALTQTTAIAAGQPVFAREADTYCGRALRSGDAQQRWGLYVEARNQSQCALAEYVLTRIASVSTVPRLADADRVLAGVDPCALVDRGTLTSLIGALPDAPKEVSAHTCVWEGSAQATINLRLLDPSIPADREIDLGEGRTLLAPVSKTAAICSRDYVVRQTTQHREQVEISVQGDSDNEKHCGAAEDIARVVVDKLPK